MTEQERKLLNAIFDTEEEGAGMEQMPENYPDTVLDKVSYSEYALISNLEYIGKAINRLSFLHSLLLGAERGGGLPDIITHNELRMALEPLLRVRADINEIVDMLSSPIFRETRAKTHEKHDPAPQDGQGEDGDT